MPTDPSPQMLWNPELRFEGRHNDPGGDVWRPLETHGNHFNRSPIAIPPEWFELRGEPIGDVDGIIVWSRQRAELSEHKHGISEPPRHGPEAASILFDFAIG